MITRKEYMENSAELHEKYYGQFVTDTVKSMVKSILRQEDWTIEELAGAYKNDKHLNFIGIQIWDRYFDSMPQSVFRAIRESGDVNARSYSNSVCVLKAAAIMLLKENEK